MGRADWMQGDGLGGRGLSSLRGCWCPSTGEETKCDVSMKGILFSSKKV